MKKILCFVLGHKYRLKRRISANVSELKCGRCKMEFGIHTERKILLPMDNELRNLHEWLISDIETQTNP